MLLDQVNSRILLRLAATSPTPTDQPEFVARARGALGGRGYFGKMNSTTPVVVMPGPTTTEQAHPVLFDMTVYNPDANTLDVEVVLEIGSGTFVVWAGSLDQGDTLQYFNGGQGGRFFVTDDSGSIKTAYSRGKETYLCDAAAGAFSVTLPSAAGSNGKTKQFKKTDSSANAVTIRGA